MHSPLQRIRIVDLTQFVVGALATQLLGNLGVEVSRNKEKLVSKVMTGSEFTDDS